MYISLVLFLPFLSFLTVFFFGSVIGHKGSSFISSASSFMTWLISLVAFLEFTYTNTSIFLNLGSWFTAGTLKVDWSFMFDSLSISMLVLVTSVSMVVQFYSLEYMNDDPYKSRFLAYLSLFSLCMIILVSAENLGVFIVGWEGVGICSYLLISFWNKRSSAVKAAMKAIVFNRIGDTGFFIGVGLIYFYTRSLDFHIIYASAPYLKNIQIMGAMSVNIYVLDIVFMFILLGVMGKSAQLGLHAWLLDAMEGPTPVSALIHSATMVTAGVYLLIRLSFILEFAIAAKVLIAVIGIITAFTASIIGTVQNDIKSIIAYSTCSQLGYMVASCGASAYAAAFFHLFNHGFFKALLFLSAGVIIHNFNEEQDIRKMGGLLLNFPMTFVFFLVGSFSLLGVPFLSGFYSKDRILEIFNCMPFNWCNLLYQLGVVSVMFTTLYSTRLIFYVFLSEPNGPAKYYINAHEKYSRFMVFGMVLLLIFSVFSGFLLKDVFIGNGSVFFFDSVKSDFLVNKVQLYMEFEMLNNKNLWFTCKTYTFYVMIIALGLFFIITRLNYNNIKILGNTYFFGYSFVYNGMFFNYVYINSVVKFVFKTSLAAFLIEKVALENIRSVYVTDNVFKLSHMLNVVSGNRNYSDIFYHLIFSSILVYACAILLI